jgi:hypothetical protein
VYAAGYYWDENNGNIDIPCYWNGGVRQDLALPKGARDGLVWSIAVSGGSVYTAGYYQDGRGHNIPCYWKDGARQDLPLPGGNASGIATSIAAAE